MYTHRLFPLLVAIALVAVAAFTVYQPIATTAVVTENSYDSIEQIRAVRYLVSNVEIDGNTT